LQQAELELKVASDRLLTFSIGNLKNILYLDQMGTEKEKVTRSEEQREMDKLLLRSAEMRARHQLTKEKVEELKELTDDFLSSDERPENASS